MSGFNKSSAIVGALLLAAVLMLPRVSWSAIDEGNGRKADLREAQSAQAKGGSDGVTRVRSLRNVVRCWQFGRLIYEAPGSLSGERTQMPTIKAPGGGVIVFYDMQNATCILEQAGG